MATKEDVRQIADQIVDEEMDNLRDRVARLDLAVRAVQSDRGAGHLSDKTTHAIDVALNGRDRDAEERSHLLNGARTPGQAAFEEAVRRHAMMGADILNPWSGIAPGVQADWEAIAQEASRDAEERSRLLNGAWRAWSEEQEAERREMIRSLLVTLQYPDLWEKRVTKALDYLKELRTNMKCGACGHEHTGPELAFICIGCPCSAQPTMNDETKPLRAWCNDYECVAARSEEEAHEVVKAMQAYADEDIDGEGWRVIPNETALLDEGGKPIGETIADLLRESDQARHLYSCEV